MTAPHDASPPRSDRFSDIYFSESGGMEESLHVFIRPNRVYERGQTRKRLNIVELGFGTGLNFLTTWKTLIGTDCNLDYVAIEKYPLPIDGIDRALTLFSELSDLKKTLLAKIPPDIPGFHPILFDSGRIRLTLIYGDARESLQKLDGFVDIWYLDGFAPSKNPDMWSDEIFRRMAELSQPGTTLSTYTVAGMVRRGLADAGFELSRLEGFGRKREMLFGSFRGPPPVPTDPQKEPWFSFRTSPIEEEKPIVVGAGLAGASMAHALAMRGYRPMLIERSDGPATGASGNPAGILYPSLTAEETPLGRINLFGFLYSLRIFELLEENGYEFGWNRCGMVRVFRDALEKEKLLRSIASLPDGVAHSVRNDEFQSITGLPYRYEGIHFPDGCTIAPAKACQAMIDASQADVLYRTTVGAIERERDTWILFDEAGNEIARSKTVVLATAYQTPVFRQTEWLPLSKVHGQIATLLQSDRSRSIRTAIGYDGYVTPAIDGRHILGASYRTEKSDLEPNPELQKEIVAKFKHLFSQTDFEHETEIAGRASFRTRAHDYLPIAGPVPDYDFFLNAYGGLANGKKEFATPPQYHPGLYVLTGLGSKGLAYAPLCGALIASYIHGDPLPIDHALSNGLNPARFIIRNLRRNRITI